MTAANHAAAHSDIPGATARPIGYWLTLVDRLIDEQFAKTLAAQQVTRRQWQLLNLLSPGPATLQRLNVAIEPFLDSDAGESAADHLRELIDRQWVDVAFENYELTGVGAQNHAELHRVVSRNRTASMQGVSAEEYEITLVVLERVARNLGWSD